MARPQPRSPDVQRRGRCPKCRAVTSLDDVLNAARALHDGARPGCRRRRRRVRAEPGRLDLVPAQQHQRRPAGPRRRFCRGRARPRVGRGGAVLGLGPRHLRRSNLVPRQAALELHRLRRLALLPRAPVSALLLPIPRSAAAAGSGREWPGQCLSRPTPISADSSPRTACSRFSPTEV